MEPQHRRALITGSSRGIGRGIALEFARDGIDVAVHFRHNEAAANATAEEIRGQGVRATVVQGDVTDPEEVRNIVRIAADALGALDIFVSNARPELAEFFQPPLEITLPQWDTAMDSQAKAFLVGAREAATFMSDGGRILAITYATGSTTGGLQPWVAMGAAKAALEATARYLAVALAPRGITVNTVSPGWTEDSVLDSLPVEAQDLIREWHQTGWTPMRRLATPADVGRAAVLLARAEAGFITGQALRVDGGASLMSSEVPPEIQFEAV